MALNSRKFWKLNGLDQAFELDTIEGKTFYDTTYLKPSFIAGSNIPQVDEHTILFITALDIDADRYVKVIAHNDEGDTELFRKLSTGDTLIWARGDVYCTSTKTVTDVILTAIDYTVDPTIPIGEEQRAFEISFNDGTKQYIRLDDSELGYTGAYPIKISDNVIYIEGFTFDENFNFVENPQSPDNPDGNTVNLFYDPHYTHVEGQGNTAIADYQHVSGSFAIVDTNHIYILGGGLDASNRFNLVTVTYGGTMHVAQDVTAGGDEEHPDYKLSDIHSVLDVDWTYVVNEGSTFNRRTYDNESYN